MAKIKVQNTEVTVITYNDKDYISLTDMVRNMENGPALIEKWLRNKNTVEFLGIWEEMYNPDFNSPEFEGIKNEAGLNRFILSVKQWVEKTNSKGIIAKAGRYGGTYAHKDIAFEFATWVSPQFKLYLLKEFQRLKEEEQAQLGWSAKRELSKINYRIHTDAIRQNLIPVEVTPAQAGVIYAEEADVLNVAMFGMTARMWREQNPGLKGNIRDYASINELICLSNMENLNAVFIDQGIPQGERLVRLNRIAIQQMRVLEDDGGKYSINSLVYWVTYVHNVVYSFYRSMIYCYINSTQRCAGSIVIDIIPTNGADKRKFFPFAPYFPVTNVIKRYFYPYFPAIIGIKGYSFPYFPYLSGIMKIKTALYSLFSRLDWHKTVVFPCLGEIYEGIRSLSWEIPVT